MRFINQIYSSNWYQYFFVNFYPTIAAMRCPYFLEITESVFLIAHTYRPHITITKQRRISAPNIFDLYTRRVNIIHNSLCRNYGCTHNTKEILENEVVGRMRQSRSKAICHYYFFLDELNTVLNFSVWLWLCVRVFCFENCLWGFC